MRYVAAIDQGTTSTRCIIFNDHLSVITEHQIQHKQYTPHPGWLEHDAEEIFNNACTCLKEAVNALRKKDPKFTKLDGVGITNQRETSIAWDKNTGKPLCHAIVWSDVRTYDVQKRVRDTVGGGDQFFAMETTGLLTSTYFSGFKYKWMLENVPEVQEARKNKTLLFGTIETWLIWKLSSGKSHCSDVSNACRTFLMDLRTQKWSKDLCNKLDIPIEALPQIRSNSEIYGFVETDNNGVRSALGDKVPICGSIGDQQGALFGNMCFSEGDAKNTYGTGCFLLMNVGKEAKISKNGLLGTVAYKLGDAPCHFALEGSIAAAGATIEWMKNNLGFYGSPREVEGMCRKVPGTEGVFFVPAFGGLLAPYWDPTARGTIVGMTFKTTKAHIMRAALQAITMQVSDVLEAMQMDSGVDITSLKVDGGLSRNRLLLEMQADVLKKSISAPFMVETTALGAALCAGLAVGTWKSLEDIKKIATEELQSDTVKATVMSDVDRKELKENWKRALQHCKWGKL